MSDRNSNRLHILDLFMAVMDSDGSLYLFYSRWVLIIAFVIVDLYHSRESVSKTLVRRRGWVGRQPLIGCYNSDIECPHSSFFFLIEGVAKK